MSEWKYKHPTHGTCEPGCRAYGWCHCGCGAHTRTNPKGYASKNRVANRPMVFVNGHAGVLVSSHQRTSRIPDCHPERKHDARGMCSSCYKQWRKNGGEAVRIKRISSKRLNWEALRYKRCLELLFEYGYSNIQAVFKVLDKELPEEAA